MGCCTSPLYGGGRREHEQASRPACHQAARPVQAWLPTSERSGLPISVLGAVISCRRRYRDVDVLLMDDDIQFLDSKPRRSPPRRSWARPPPTLVFSSRTCAGPPAPGCWLPPGTSPSSSRPRRADLTDASVCTQFVDNIVRDIWVTGTTSGKPRPCQPSTTGRVVPSPYAAHPLWAENGH